MATDDKEEREPIPQRQTVPLWPHAGRVLGLGRNGTYDAAARGEIPTLQFGRRKVVSKKLLARLLDGQAA
jgi:hypothetical protein